MCPARTYAIDAARRAARRNEEPNLYSIGAHSSIDRSSSNLAGPLAGQYELRMLNMARPSSGPLARSPSIVLLQLRTRSLNWQTLLCTKDTTYISTIMCKLKKARAFNACAHALGTRTCTRLTSLHALATQLSKDQQTGSHISTHPSSAGCTAHPLTGPFPPVFPGPFLCTGLFVSAV